MKYLYVFDLFLLLFGLTEGIFRCWKSKKFLVLNGNGRSDSKKLDYSEVVILIPVYNEQNVIRQSVLNFKPLMEQGIEVIYVATEKETVTPTTYDMLKGLIQEYNLQQHCKVLKYPKKNGVMAHQLNYAVQNINDNKIILIYNVDSLVQLSTVNYILKNRGKLEQGVFQQYSYSAYDENGLAIMNHAIMWQNRWSIAYELPRTIQFRRGIIRKFNYVIGHGLAIKREMLVKLGAFSEAQINEDNILGYRLHANGVKVYPIPHLEKIDFAKNRRIYVNQQSVWFNGPLYAFRYYQELKKESQNYQELFFAACQNFKNALNWNLFSYMNIVLLCITFINRQWLMLGGLVIAMLLYVQGVSMLAEKVLIDTGYLKKRMRDPFLYSIRELYFWLLLHSTGPMLTLWKIVSRRNNQLNKYKTEK